MTTPRDFLAIVTMQAGGGSYYRAADPFLAALKAAQQARKDWQKVFAIPKGHTWTVPVYDVTNHANVRWNDQGVFDEDTNEQIARHSIEKVTA